MATFYGTITNNRNTFITKANSEKTGMNAHIRGWNIGAEIDLSVDSNDNDILSIKITGGSNNDIYLKTIGNFKIVNGELVQL